MPARIRSMRSVGASIAVAAVSLVLFTGCQTYHPPAHQPVRPRYAPPPTVVVPKPPPPRYRVHRPTRGHAYPPAWGQPHRPAWGQPHRPAWGYYDRRGQWHRW
ncbi:hypothetical protein SAMN05421720_101528 [Rhodospira trueperi]|uniref:Uncharacterized protein n=1 Tax=Rhodospira trueperi TaxID=69960 RepID=A0A1G6XM82_9PROT|nr:hypothetical protein SAMN05421720_101528 [Rhodospira trueperi]